MAERERLRHLEALRGGRAAGAEALAPDGGRRRGDRCWPRPRRRSTRSAGVDPELDALAERLRGAARSRRRTSAASCAATRRRVEAAPGRLEEVEDRLDAPRPPGAQARRHVAAVLEHAERCRERRDELEHAEEALADARRLAGRGRARARRARRAELRDARARRRRQARRARSRERLGDAGDGGRDVRGRARARASEPGPTGADAVEFLIAPNPGVPAGAAARDRVGRRALARDARAAERRADGRARRTLVFDEVDAGIGGQTARAVGEQLRALAEGRQILCITHLPQIASLAERHFRIAKDAAARPRARPCRAARRRTSVVGELVRMLGADEDDVRRATPRAGAAGPPPRTTRALVRLSASVAVSHESGAAVARARSAGVGPRSASAQSSSSSGCAGRIAIIDHETSTASRPRTWSPAASTR